MIRATAKAIQRCHHCGSSLIIENIDGEPYCLPCGRPYQDFSEYGRKGGLKTYSRYGSEHMSIIGRQGGRPRQKDLRQQTVPTGKIELKGGMSNRFLASRNNLKVLKELWRERREESLAANSSSQEVLAE